jgi:hypothetical protein
MHYLSQKIFQKDNPNILTVKINWKEYKKIEENMWNGEKMQKKTKEDENSWESTRNQHKIARKQKRKG